MSQPASTLTSSVLLVGAGDLGTQIGLTFACDGYRVWAVRRRAELVPEPLIGVGADITNGLPEIPGLNAGPDVIVFCLTAGARDADAYRRTYVDGVARSLESVRSRGWSPKRAVFISSTAVCAPAGIITEETPSEPQGENGKILAEAERSFLEGLPAGCRGIVLRPSGIYGPGREWMINQVRAGAISDPHRMTHRVHRDDVARAVRHVVQLAEPDQLYLVTDDEPVRADDVAAFLAEELKIPWKRTPENDAAISRRLVNQRLRDSGFTFTYPSYREGYRSVLQGNGIRYP